MDQISFSTKSEKYRKVRNKKKSLSCLFSYVDSIPPRYELSLSSSGFFNKSALSPQRPHHGLSSSLSSECFEPSVFAPTVTDQYKRRPSSPNTKQETKKFDDFGRSSYSSSFYRHHSYGPREPFGVKFNLPDERLKVKKIFF
jgi:hypothetical protein